MPLPWENGPPPKHASITLDLDYMLAANGGQPFRAIKCGGTPGTTYTLTVLDYYGTSVQYTVTGCETVVVVGRKVTTAGTTATGLVAQF